MPPRPIARWLLVGSLTLSSATALTTRAAQADEATVPHALAAREVAAIAQTLDPSGGGISPPRQTHASTEPSSERKREACFNEKSLPWLPAVELPEPKSPGQSALGWRPRWLLSQPLSRDWIAGALVALVVATALELTRRRRRWEWLALVAAAGPCLVGFALAHRHLDHLVEGLSQTWWCIPREGVFQRNAQLARDALTLGALASLPALAWLLVLASLPRRPSNLRAFAPVSALLLLAAWLTWRHWPEGREGELAREVSGVMAGVEAAGLRLAEASSMTQTRLPDVPLVLVSADGTLRYDDSRGHQAPTAMPQLLRQDDRIDLNTLHDDADERPPFFLLAIDERATWQSVQRALEPFGKDDFLLRQWLVFGPNGGEPGSSPRVPGIPPRRLVTPPERHHVGACIAGDQLPVRGRFGDGGMHLTWPVVVLGDGVGPQDSAMNIAREQLDRTTLSQTFDRLRAMSPRYIHYTETPPDKVELLLHLTLSPATLWREVALLEDEVARRGKSETIYLNIEEIDGPGW